jgi:putative hydrolase of the HAD superfamily
MASPFSKVLVLDAMGVIYRVGDDVADLLVPFIREKGGIDDDAQIEAAYLKASLGEIDAAEFWRRVHVSPDLEDEYLMTLELSDELLEFLEAAATQFRRLACLSNDLSAWSRKLRKRFGLESYIARWYISGDLGVRKPDPNIYRRMLSDLAVTPADIVFVDDRLKNLRPAAELGMRTVHFNPAGSNGGDGHGSISRFSQLLR